ncbi:glucose-6-phosphate isomerase [Candidatus Nanopelagicales bacterium]|nr:glucose-6-phosphate isomerase [Candidatus Nanopelagicales bacterium]
MVNAKSINPTATQPWQRLADLARSSSGMAIGSLIHQDRDYLRLHLGGITFDFSRQRVDSPIFETLMELVTAVAVADQRDAMFAGEPINTTEGRSVLHVALRAPASTSLYVGGVDVVREVHEVLDAMADFAESIRTGRRLGATGREITDVVNIGIGGSDLGPAMAYRALHAYRSPSITCHFVSNVDPADLADVLATVDPETTLFIVASKTFTTQETMANAHTARRWLAEALGADAVPAHFVAVSTALDKVAEFGIAATNVFGFWDWVGGRYSMTSAVGLSTMIAIGPENYRSMLDGFAAMDEHFRTAPAPNNVPIVMGMMAVWNRTFLDIPTTAVLPYSQHLSRFPAYLQQLTMESNGKSVRLDGSVVNYRTGAIYWGEPGTNGQHSFYQLLHQGTDDVSSDIIVTANPDSGSDDDARRRHDMLVANALAQASVLACGITADELRSTDTADDLVPHKMMAGNHPVSVILLRSLTPFALGLLVAAYEHSVFVQGAVWQINPFDQWGVELGKKVASGIVEDLASGRSEDPSLDPATQNTLAEILRMQANSD